MARRRDSLLTAPSDYQKPIPKLSMGDRAAVEKESWLRGNLRYLTKPGPQRDFYDRFHRETHTYETLSPYVLNWHRRCGKTFVAILLLIENCIRYPKRLNRYVNLTQGSAATAVEDHIPEILSHCPNELMPKANRKDLTWSFYNPRWKTPTGKKDLYISTLKLHGVSKDKGISIRGKATNGLIIDEAAFVENLSHLYASVLSPTFRGRDKPFALMTSTPPEDLSQDFAATYIPRAETEKRYIFVPTTANPGWTPGEDETAARESGGRETAAYRREYLCELISSGQNLIIPEFADRDQPDGSNPFVFSDRSRPSHFHAFEVGDIGRGIDPTALLFAYLDFERQQIVIESEYLSEDDTATFAANWTVKDKAFLAGGGKAVEVYRGAETDPMRLRDLHIHSGLRFSSVSNKDKDAARSQCRTLFAKEKILISENCSELILQLRNGTMTRSGEFSRTQRLGHCDLVAALIYLCRAAQGYWDKNPFPTPTRNPVQEFYFDEPPEFTWNGRFIKSLGWRKSSKFIQGRRDRRF